MLPTFNRGDSVKMKSAILAAAAASTFLLCNVNAQDPAPWGACGGIYWTGSANCPPGQVCTYQNQYYSQCLPITIFTTTIDTLPTSPPAGVPADW
ncbi:hypothetical protein BD779DRAFT_1505728 [Infundibulicybe gibba]|nr:hypothetical protein BD779DRAFT_1505728 [Infundibulicybe gibba]